MMFFLPPPPPRYTAPIAYAAGTVNGMPVPLTETNNVIKHPEGGCPLQVGEGTYELREDLHLATPPPHPSEPPPINPNPLLTTPSQPTCGVRLTPVILKSCHDPPNTYRKNTLEGALSDLRIIKENDHEGRRSAETRSSNRVSNDTAPAFGEGTLALTNSHGKESSAHKRRKPRNNMLKSTSTFISRVQPSDQWMKRLAERNQDGVFVFANINRSLQWLDYGDERKHDPLTKMFFARAQVMSHDVNQVTKGISHLDVVVGTSTGDILWYEPMGQKYARINKNTSINRTPVSHIQWIPGSENLFMAAHFDGCIVVYDKEKEDGAFVPDTQGRSSSSVDEAGSSGSPPALNILKSVNSSNQKTNPVACWKLSNHRVNSFAFSPDRRHLAIVVEDGTLRIMDYLEERLLDVFTSYYGGLICVCWSPDGNYIVTGGQDDLVTIWSFAERKIVARCQGHSSWVTGVAFDPWRCDERNYRFGSVGDDCQLLLWDFSDAMLYRPKAANARQRNSIIAGSLHPTSRSRSRTENSITRSDSAKTLVDEDDDGVKYYPIEPRAMTAQLPPILSAVISEDPVTWIGFLEDCIMTSSLEGHIRTWTRPEN